MRYRLGIILSSLVLLFSFLHGEAIYAASASVAFSVASDDIEEGESFVVTITAQSSAGVGGFQTYIAYDTSMLELVDTGKHVSGSDGLIQISDMKKGNKQIREYHVTFKALQQGDTKVYISDDVYMYASTTKEQMSVSKNSLQIHVSEKKKKTVSSNVGLASLKVNEGKLLPDFQTNITNYTLDVSAQTDMVFFDTKTKRKTDTVEIVGNDNLKEGENIATILVSSKNGNSKTYTIVIKKSAEQTEDVTSTDQPDTNVTENENAEDKLVLYQDGEVQHLKTAIDLEIMSVPSSSVIPTGYKESSEIINGTKLTVYVKENGQKLEPVLVYGKVGEQEAQFYKLDRIDKTLQRYRATEEETATEKQDVEVNGILCWVVLLMAGVILVLVLRNHHLKKRQMYYYEDTYEEERTEQEDDIWDRD